jgi:hypothetical protein
MPSPRSKGIEGAGVDGGLQDAAATLVDIAEHGERVAAGSGQRADFGRIVALAVLMRGDDGHRAATCLERSRERVGKALAVVVVGVGDRERRDPFFLQDVGHDLALTRIRRRGAEEQAIVLDRRQARRRGGRRDRGHAIRHGDIVDDGARDAGTVGAHDRDDIVGRDEALGSGSGRSGIDAGGIGAHRSDRLTTEELAGIGSFLHRHFRAGGHGWCQRLDRAGKAEDHTHLHFGLGRCGQRENAGGGKKQSLSHNHVTP